MTTQSEPKALVPAGGELIAQEEQRPTFIALILDRSGSMEKIRTATIDGFNTYIEDQQRQPGEATFLGVQFDHEYLVVQDRIPMHTVPKLTSTTYVPRGDTRLLDAIGRTINDVDAWIQKTGQQVLIMIVIITDGKENDSKEFTLEMIKTMIADRIARGWKFMYNGANQNATEVATSMNIPASHSSTFAADHAGTREVFRSMSQSTSMFRDGGSAAVDSNGPDPKK